MLHNGEGRCIHGLHIVVEVKPRDILQPLYGTWCCHARHEGLHTLWDASCFRVNDLRRLVELRRRVSGIFGQPALPLHLVPLVIIFGNEAACLVKIVAVKWHQLSFGSGRTSRRDDLSTLDFSRIRHLDHVRKTSVATIDFTTICLLCKQCVMSATD